MRQEAPANSNEGNPVPPPAVGEARARFEQAWLANANPLLEEFLDQVDADQRAPLLRELLGLEAELLQQKGIVPYLGSYLGRFPHHAEVVEDVLGPFVRTHHGGQQGSEIQLGVPLPEEEPPPRPLPTVLPGYELIKLLGHGGMGIVYLARDQRLKRLVAIKMIRHGGGSPVSLESRFRREAEAIARLQHPHIVQVFEVGNHQGIPYLVLEYVAGGNLARFAAGQPQAARWAAELVSKLADAIQAAHQAGIVHRDLKPANVLLTTDGVPKLTDFGLAKLQDGPDGGRNGQTTGNDVLLGTASYMPPEQAPGRAEELGPAADVYSLGAILYELLTGRPPFLGVTLQHTLLMVESVEPLSPRRLNPQLPRDLETVCLTCLRKDPARRYATAALLGDDLRRFLRNEPIQARESRIVERTWRWILRNPLNASLLLLLLVVLITETALAWSLSILATRQAREALATAQQARADEQQAREAVRTAQAEVQRFVVRESVLRRQLYASNVNIAGLAFQDNDVLRAQTALERSQPQPGEEDLRGFEWHYLWRASHCELMTRRAHAAGVRAVAWNADGSRFATCGDEQIKIWNSQNGLAVLSIKLPGRLARSLLWCPVANLVLMGGEDAKIRGWDAVTGSEQLLLAGHDKAVTGLAISADGRWLISGSLDQTVRVWDLSRRETVTTFKTTSDVQAVALSPDAAEIAAACRSGAVRLFQRENNKEPRTVRADGEIVRAVSYSPDGRWLAFGGSDRQVFVMNRQNTRELLALRGHQQAAMALAWTPDSRRLISASLDQTLRMWEMGSEREVVTLRGHTAAVSAVAVSADGQRVLSGSEDDTVKLWKTDPEQLGVLMRGHEDGVQCLAWSPDGSRIASGSRDRTIRIWDALTHTSLLQVDGYKGSIFRVAWSPDGTRLASAGGDKTVRIHDGRTGQELLKLAAHTGSVFGVAWSPQGDRLYSAGADKTIRLWDAATGQLLKTLDDHTAEIRCLALSTDGTRLVTGGLDGTLQVRDPITGAVLLTTKPHTQAMRDLAISVDKRWIVCGCYDGTLLVLDAETGQARHARRESNAPIDAVAISPDGQRYLSGSRDRRLRIWDMQSGLLLFTMSDIRSAVLGVAFRPDGKQIGAATEGKGVRLW